jgi:serine/threonine protein kinase
MSSASSSDNKRLANAHTDSKATTTAAAAAAAAAAAGDASGPSGNAAPSSSGANGPQGPPVSVNGGRKKCYKIRGTNFVVDPHYDVIKAIGLGAYGLVCSAKDTKHDRFVAVKKIPKLFDDLVDGKRVLRELKIMRFLGRHQNIIELYDVLSPCEDSKSELESFRDVYVVTVLMDTDLHLILKSKQKLNFEHHAFFMYQLLRGISFVHSAGVIHRDLKPGNLLLDGKCELRICDFGLARGGIPLHPEGRTDKPRTSVQPQELTDYVITRWYRPPELLLMAPYHHGVDMWSIGCIMAEVLLRKALFQGRDYMHQLTLIAEVVDIPATPEEVAVALPKTGPEQCRYVSRLAQKAVQHERPDASGKMPDTKARLFARFGLQSDKCSNTWNRVMDLIAGLLVFDASKRLSSYQALRHPYLSHLFKPADDVSHPERYGAPDPRQWEFDLRELSEMDLRELFWDEMKKGSSLNEGVGPKGSNKHDERD